MKSTFSKKILHFLLVDDDDSVRRTIYEYLMSFGFTQISQAKNGLEAAAILKKEKIDFVISDWEMPEASGLDLLRILRSDEKLKNIPFIMVTSPISKEMYKVIEAATSNVDAYIIKPFRSQVLKDRIEKVLVEKSFEGKLGALVVDDDLEARETIVDYLKEMGRTPIFEAGDGDEAFELLKKHAKEIAVVISDWEMPRLAGIDLLKRIREDEKLGETPFIMVTSQTSIERVKVKRALDADVDHYLLKPFRMEELKTKVTQALNGVKVKLAVQEELRKAFESIDVNAWADAEIIFQRILSLDPTNIAAFLGLASLQTKLNPQNGLEKRIHYIREAIAIHPKSEQAHVELALTFESAMSLDKAIQTLRQSLKELEFSEQLHFHLGRLLLRRGFTDEGIKNLKKAVELKPDYIDAIELLEAKGISVDD